MSKTTNKKLPVVKRYNTLFENSISSEASSKSFFLYKLPNSKDGSFTPYKKIPRIGEQSKPTKNFEHYSSDGKRKNFTNLRITSQKRNLENKNKIKTSTQYNSLPTRNMVRRNTYVVLEPIVLGKFVKVHSKNDQIDTETSSKNTESSPLLDNSVLFGSKIDMNGCVNVECKESSKENNIVKIDHLNSLSTLISNLKLSRNTVLKGPLKNNRAWFIN